MIVLAWALLLTPADIGQPSGEPTIIYRALEVVGGQRALMIYKAGTWTVTQKDKGKFGTREGVSTFQYTIQGPTQCKVLHADLSTTILLNGNRAWVLRADREPSLESLSGELLASLRDTVYVEWMTTFLPLREKGTPLTVSRDFQFSLAVEKRGRKVTASPSVLSGTIFRRVALVVPARSPRHNRRDSHQILKATFSLR